MNKQQLINGFPFIPYEGKIWNESVALQHASEIGSELSSRRSLRDFSTQTFSVDIINACLRAASCAPSGANKQPWVFCVVTNPDLKKEIREAAEREEYESYHNRMSDDWLNDIRPLQTDWKKPFLEDAPYLIVVFKKIYDILPDGAKKNNYYVSESVGLACGFLLVALHRAGLVALTHTPSPMNFLTRLLQRGENERPFLLIPVGLPAPGACVPDLPRKTLPEMAVYFE